MRIQAIKSTEKSIGFTKAKDQKNSGLTKAQNQQNPDFAKTNGAARDAFLANISFKGYSKTNHFHMSYGTSGELVSGPEDPVSATRDEKYAEVQQAELVKGLRHEAHQGGNPFGHSVHIETYYADIDELVDMSSIPEDTQVVVRYVEPEIPSFSEVKKHFINQSYISLHKNIVYFDALKEPCIKKLKDAEYFDGINKDGDNPYQARRGELYKQEYTEKLEQLEAQKSIATKLEQLISEERSLRSDELRHYEQTLAKLSEVKSDLKSNEENLPQQKRQKQQMENDINNNLSAAQKTFDNCQDPDEREELQLKLSLARAEYKRTEPTIQELQRKIAETEDSISRNKDYIKKFETDKQKMEASESLKELQAKRQKLLSRIEEHYKKNYPECL